MWIDIGSPFQRYGHVHAVRLEKRMALRYRQIFGDHLGAHLVSGNFRHPAKLGLRLAWIAEQGVHFGRAKITRVDATTTSPGFTAGAFSPVTAATVVSSSTPWPETPARSPVPPPTIR